METPGQYFPGQQLGEKVFLLIRKHWFNYIVFFVFVFFSISAIITALVLTYIYSADLTSLFVDVIIVTLSMFSLFVLGVLLYGFVDIYMDTYIVTDRRVIDITQGGFFKRDISELHLHQIQDISSTVDSMFGTFLHFGDVIIQTAGEREKFIFKSIPHPYRIAKQIIDLHEARIDPDYPGPQDAEALEEDDDSMPYKETYKQMVKKGEEDEIFHKAEVAPKTVTQEEVAPKLSQIQPVTKKSTNSAELEEGKEVDISEKDETK